MHDSATVPLSPALPPAELQRLLDAIQRERQQLADERRRYRQEQADLRLYWRRRLRSEWQRLEQDSVRVQQERQKFKEERQHAATHDELQRRQLEAERQELRAQHRAWREEQARRESELAAREQALGQTQQHLEAARASWDDSLHELQRIQQRKQAELCGLESRIANLRTVLARLQTERARVDEQLTPTVVTLPRSSAPTPPDQAAADRLLTILADLKDEEARLARFHDGMLQLREAWQQEWDRADAALADREADLETREQGLRERSQMLRDWMLQLHRQRDENQQRGHQVLSTEARLLRQRSELHCERGRLLALVRARAMAARARLRLGLELRERAVDLSLEYAARQQQLADRELQQRRDALECQQQLERRQCWLDERERELEAKELAIFHAEQQLLARDPDPVEAAAELNRRFQHLLRQAQRPLRRLEQREAEMAALHEDLEAFRHRLLAEEQHLSRERAQLESRFALDERRRALWESSRARVRQELTALRLENRRLQEHVGELRDQLERLALVLLETPPPQPGLKLALAA